jgi:hypothetical protein
MIGDVALGLGTFLWRGNRLMSDHIGDNCAPALSVLRRRGCASCPTLPPISEPMAACSELLASWYT